MDKFKNDLEDHITDALVYGMWPIYCEMPSASAILSGIYWGDPAMELPRGKPISEAEDLDLLMFPRLLETIEVGTKRYEEVSKSRAKQTVKVLSDWFQSLSHELGTQYRYVCICPAPQCAKRVEFFSYRSGEQITWADCPKCETCK